MKKKQNKIKIIAFILTVAILFGMVPLNLNTYAVDNGDGGIIETESTNFDVFMNVDPSYGDASSLQAKVASYLDKLIQQGGGSEKARFYSTSTKVDPTDLTKWSVYDHYDTTWYPSQADWESNYKGRGDVSIPETWYYYGLKEGSVSGTNSTAKTNYPDTGKQPQSGQLTIQDISEGNGQWAKTSYLREHIRTYTDAQSGKPAMQFYGYGTSNWADFLYYPATTTSTKKVDFDIDASDVRTHSLKYTGFLINTGVNGTPGTDSATMNGYSILFEYSGPSSGTATGLTGIYLYKLDNVNVNKLHAEGLKGITGAGGSFGTATKIATAATAPYYKNSHISLEITGTTLKATISDNNNGGTSPVAIFDIKNNADFTDTGFGGFGPYVDYGVSGHTCADTSTFLYSNLEMSFTEPVGTDSALAAYQYADYLKKSDQRFFINLTTKDKTTSSYGNNATDIDKGYLTLIQKDKTILLTDEGTTSKNTIYPETYLKQNTKNVFNDTSNGNDVTMDDIKDIYTGNNPDDIMTAKLAWLIYHSKWSEDIDKPDQKTIIVSDVKLMSSPVGTTDNIQVSQINRELINSQKLKVYPDPSNSVNVTPADTPVYTLTWPDGKKTQQIALNGDGSFEIENDKTKWPEGVYNLNITYIKDPNRTDIAEIIENNTSFTVLSDSTAPTSGTPTISKINASVTFDNTVGTNNYSFVSNLDSYAFVVNDGSGQPTNPTYTAFTNDQKTQQTVSISNYNLGDSLTAGSHYLHAFVKDEAGNVSWKATSFTITGPTAAFKESGNPYKGNDIHILPTAGSYDIAKVEVSVDNGTTWVEVNADPTNGYEYTLPAGKYTLQTKVTDTAGNSGTKLIAIDALKMQEIAGTKVFNLEKGIDTSILLDNTAVDATDHTSLTGAAISNVISDNTSGVIATLNGNNVTISTDKTGTATIKVGAAQTSIYREVTDTITINVKDPLSIKLNAKLNDDETGIVVNPAYTKGFYDVNSLKLEYRKKGDSQWTTVNDWTYGSDYTFNFADLTDYVEYEVQVSATDTRGTAASDKSEFRTPDDKPQITSSNVSDGIIGDTFEEQMTATGTKPLVWSVKDPATLPDGLVLDPSTGKITGTPTTKGDYTFTIVVTNPAGNTAEKEFTMHVYEPPIIVTPKLDDTILGKDYTQQLTATGDPIITWSITPSKARSTINGLPNGLTLNPSTGAITGKALEAGTFTFTAIATSPYGEDTHPYTIFVAAPPTITTETLTNSRLNAEYLEQLEVDGDGTITWTLQSGQLPDGVTLVGDGTLSGTCTKPGTYTFVVEATSEFGTDTKEFTIFVAEPPVITTQKVADTIRGNAYSQQLEATGDHPIGWGITAGKLPVGLTLDPTTGLISGTPKEAGTFKFTVIATNNVDNDTIEYTLFVGNPPTIDDKPQLPDNVGPGKDFDYTIDVDGDGPFKWDVVEGEMPDGLHLDPDTGKITGKPIKPGDYTFVVEVTNDSGTQRKEITISIPFPPTIIEQPKNQIINDKDQIIFNVEVDGTAPFTYQWQVNRGNGWENIDGANAKEYAFASDLWSEGTVFRCIVANKADTIISKEVTLTLETSTETTTPSTGDNTATILWVTTMGIALLGLGYSVLTRKKIIK